MGLQRRFRRLLRPGRGPRGDPLVDLGRPLDARLDGLEPLRPVGVAHRGHDAAPLVVLHRRDADQSVGARVEARGRAVALGATEGAGLEEQRDEVEHRAGGDHGFLRRHVEVHRAVGREVEGLAARQGSHLPGVEQRLEPAELHRRAGPRIAHRRHEAGRGAEGELGRGVVATRAGEPERADGHPRGTVLLPGDPVGVVVGRGEHGERVRAVRRRGRPRRGRSRPRRAAPRARRDRRSRRPARVACRGRARPRAG